jgi:hypothetical protein
LGIYKKGSKFGLEQPTYRPPNRAVRQLVHGETGRAIVKVMIEGKIVVDSGKGSALLSSALA